MRKCSGRSRPRWLRLAATLSATSLACPLVAAVRGTVVNGTSGAPAEGVMLTLSSFQGGMTPIEETQSQANGSFAFEKDLPPVGAGQPFRGAIRAELDGVGYTEILRAGAALEGIRVTVYSASPSSLPDPNGRVVILEPSGGEMLVRESYQFFNGSEPPVTYSSELGTLQFYLPPEAEGVVQVSGEGPQDMPLRSTALPADEAGLFKVDFPLKPGESSISLTYVLPYEGTTQFEVRSPYAGVLTRLAAPEGVTLRGMQLEPFGEHPGTKASIYSVVGGEPVTVTVEGEGALPPSAPAAPNPETQVSIAPAQVAHELLWIVSLAVLILGLGFFHLWTSQRPGGTQARAPGDGTRPAR